VLEVVQEVEDAGPLLKKKSKTAIGQKMISLSASVEQPVSRS
jgi:hypothetical protein